MDLYIYDQDINRLGIIDGYSSLRWRRRYFEPGEVELHCPASASNLALLQEGNIIHRLDRQEAAIIEGVDIKGTDQGDEITVTGRMGSSMLDRRIVMPTVNFDGTVEAAMRKLVSDNAITVRPLPHLVLGSVGELTPTVSFQATWKTVLMVIEALGRAAPIGFRVRLDVPGQQWIFEVYDGVDRSVGQTVLPQVVFCGDNENIANAEYARNSIGYANYAIVGGQGEGSDRVIVTVDQTNGEDRRELWVDAKDLTSTGSAEENFLNGDEPGTTCTLSRTPTEIQSVTIAGQSAEYTLNGNVVTITGDWAPGATIMIAYTYPMTPAEYAAVLAQRGTEKLAEVARTENFSADAVDTANYRYLTDWGLGDIVSFERWGLRLDRRITEVEEVYEGGIVTITPVCGNPLPEALDLGSDT